MQRSWQCCFHYMSRGITPLLKSDSCLLAQYRVGRTIVRRKSTPPVSDRISSSAHSPVKLSWYHILWKPAAFTAGVCVVSFSASFVYHNIKRKREGQWGRPRPWMKERKGLFGEIHRQWNMLTDSAKTVVGLIGVNCLVFLMWRLPFLQPMMARRFLADPYSKSVLPLLLSNFSHIDLWHLLINMVVLWNFFLPYIGSGGQVGAEMAVGYTRLSTHFSLLSCNLILLFLSAMYTPEVSVPYFISAGVFASCVGHIAKTARGLALPSLGASGALMAVVTSITYQHPDSHFYIIFLPFIPIPAVWALGSVIALDMAGLVMGWRFFDHAAHLGGVLFGLLFQSQILPQVPKLRHKTLTTWNRLTDN